MTELNQIITIQEKDDNETDLSDSISSEDLNSIEGDNSGNSSNHNHNNHKNDGGGIAIMEAGARVNHLYPQHTNQSRSIKSVMTLSLSSLGIIYGDIGTSPLYVFSSMFDSGMPGYSDVIGALSLIIWSLILVVCVKYVCCILRVDNNGEGGIMALRSLLPKHGSGAPRWLSQTLTITAIAGASFILGDGVITPAISVLSAIEGIQVGVPSLESWVVPITFIILLLLFLLQSFGTDRIGRAFGPIMLLWFIVIGVIGGIQLARNPRVLNAFNPIEGVTYINRHGGKGFLQLGTVILCVTGVEAMYSDLGHFGALPIRISWFFVAFPSLLLNYLGQGSLYLDAPSTSNPFYEMVPKPLFWPMIVLATLATIIASQALISGSFSIVNQSLSLHCFPRVKVHHTSRQVYGQIYIAEINFFLMILTLIVVVGFQHSSKLIAAYGLGVASVMVMTTILYVSVIYYRLRYPLPLVIFLGTIFLSLDLAFFAACIVKIPTGGWFPITVGLVISTIMLVWRYGRRAMVHRIHRTSSKLDHVIKSFSDSNNNTDSWSNRTRGAVFLSHYPSMTPLALTRLRPFLTSLPHPLFFVSVNNLPVPFIADPHRIVCHEYIQGRGIYQVLINYGYSEIMNIDQLLSSLSKSLLSNHNNNDNTPSIDDQLVPSMNDNLTFFLSRESVHYSPLNDDDDQDDVDTTGKSKLRCGYYIKTKIVNAWRYSIASFFNFLLNNSRSAADTFGIKPQSVIEVGSRIDIH